MIPKSSKNTNLEDETNIYLVDFMRKESNLIGKESFRPPPMIDHQVRLCHQFYNIS